MQFCYDWADRVLSTANSGTVAGANQITDGFGADEIWYDVRGNTRRLADLQFSYDADNQHIGTVTYKGSRTSLVRDAAGRVVSRTVDPAGDAPAVTKRYLYAGAGDSPVAVVSADASSVWMLSLPGEVTVDAPSAGRRRGPTLPCKATP